MKKGLKNNMVTAFYYKEKRKLCVLMFYGENDNKEA